MSSKFKRNIFVIFIIMVNVGIDQISKYYAQLYIQGRGRIQVIGNLFRLEYAENSGAFLGLGSNIPQPWKTIVMVLFPALAIILGTIYLIFGKKVSFKQAVCLACIIGGGIGNVYDRATNMGKVVDFLNFGIGPGFRTGVLNIADLSITFGAIFLILFQYLEEKKEKQLTGDIGK